VADLGGVGEPQAYEIAALRLLRSLSSDALSATDMPALLSGLLDKWIALHRADFGNIQLYDRERRTLRIAVQRGFQARFLTYFAEVDANEASACGMALNSGSPIIIEDVEADPAYAPSLEEARAAGYRAVQSTPLLARDREPLAMVSTHFREPRRFAERELRFSELAARQTADAIRARFLHDELEASRERLRRVLETDAVGVIFFDEGSGTLIDANDVFLRMTGYSREEVKGRLLTWRDMTPPEWVRTSEEQMALLEQTGRLGPYEKEYVLKDGSRAWLMFAGRSLGDGTAVEYCVDISDRKRVEAERELLAHELAHRIKNTLAVVQAIANQTADTASSVEAFRTAFLGRLHALSAAHDLLIDAQWRNADLKAVVEQAIAPFRTDHGQRIEISGLR
jgi:PAS domain S-box-containing protein